MMSKDCYSICAGLLCMSFFGKGGPTVGWAWAKLVTLVGLTSCGSEIVGSNATWVFGISVMRGGLGIGRVVPYLKYIFTTFRVVPRSIKTFLIDYPFIITFTTRLPRLEYLGMINFPNIMLANCLTTWTVVGSFFFLPRFSSRLF